MAERNRQFCMTQSVALEGERGGHPGRAYRRPPSPASGDRLTLSETGGLHQVRLIPGSSISSARWQATKCAGLISRKSGGWVRQTSAA